MKLKYLENIIPAQEGAAKVAAISCSANLAKIAIATHDRNIILLDEKGEQRDKFATKPIDSKFGKKSYSILSIAFSPDSSKLAVGQSDNVVYVYKIGATWNEKKVIVNKMPQPAAVAALDWPFDDKLLIGLADGKARVGLLKNNKCQSLFKTEQPITALTSNPKKTAFITGHLDGSIIIYNFSSKSQSKICTHPVPPYCLVFTAHGLVAAGSDRRVFSYTENGVVQQQFDFSDDEKIEKEFSAIVTDPTGQNVAIGSYDRVRLFSWSQRRGAWEEGAPLDVPHLYTVTALAWRADGATLYAGAVTGSVISIDCCLRRGMLKSRFETTHVAPSHVIVRDVTTEVRTSVQSAKGLAIDQIKMMGRDRFAVAYTQSTVLVADTETGKCSELEWHSGGHEKFYFDYAHVCMIVNAGEVTVVEFGVDGALGWVRTELTSPHLISIRISDRGAAGISKKIAYLTDPTTIAIMNLVNSDHEQSISHTATIDWVELNEYANKLLFRDRRSRVTLLDLTSGKSTALLSFCSYVQWVPASDVIVAQSGDQLMVWYNPSHPEQVTSVQVKGEVEDVLRDAERTEVIVQEASAKVAYELESAQIEFGSALDRRDLARAVHFLESSVAPQEAYSMWQGVGELAIEERKLLIAQRCYAAIGDIAKAKILQQIADLAMEASKGGGDGTDNYKVRAMIARLRRDFKGAERIYMEETAVDEAIAMWQSLHKWDDALELAKATNYPGYDALRASYMRSLTDTGQDAKAAELRLSEGDSTGAVQLFLKANRPVQALKVALSNDKLIDDQSVTDSIAASLMKNQLYDKAGDLFRRLKDFEKALDSYRKGHAYAQAIELARTSYPERVVDIEEEWGDHLVKEGHHDAAISHYLESNKTVKAATAAVRAKEWSKAVQIVDVIQDPAVSKDFYGKIANHYANSGDFERAERLFIEADSQKEAVSMYLKNNKWNEAYRLSEEFFGKEEAARLYEGKAEELEQQGRLADAEQLYISIGQSNKAIQMYRNANRNEDVVRLVEKYHTEHLEETHKRLAMDLEERGDLKSAEEEYMKAGDWKSAVNMYRENEMWSDAYRIAKSEGGDAPQRQIAYLWAKSLGGEAAVRLLTKFGMLGEAIDLASENGAFDFAFELAKIGAKERLPEVHTRMAVQLEEDGKIEEAAQHYVEGGKAEEAVAMFIHDADWTNAERVAKEHAPNSLNDVYTGEARRALEEGDHHKAEGLLLRANKPDIILRYFKESGMWPDVLRIAKEYLPHQLAALQEEFDQSEIRSGARGVESFLAQAKEWEAQAEHLRACQAYLRVSPETSTDEALVKQCAYKAADIAMKFLGGTNEEVFVAVLTRLAEIEAHEKAAEVLLSLGQTRPAIDAFCRAKEWGKAKQVAKEFLPEMVSEIEAAYKDSLKSEGRLGELIDVDVISAIDLLVERGQWEKALETARQQKHGPLLDKYVALFASDLIQQGDYARATKVFEKYGASANAQNFNIYKSIFDEAVAQTLSPTEEFDRLVPVRDMFLSVVENMKKERSQHAETFTRFLIALHLLTFRAALSSADSDEIKRLRLKHSLSMLRYSDLVPADRVFYEAGVAAREEGGVYENLAFLLLNHYLDLCEAIEEGNGDMVDYSVFEGTDIPSEIPIPSKLYLESSVHEELKEWVLAASVDSNVEKELTTDARGVFEASLVANGVQAPMCCISGFPISGARIDLSNDMQCEREELNRFLIQLKANPTDGLMDVQSFLSRWSGSPLAMAL